MFKLVFPDTRGGVSESGRGRWVDKPLGSVVVGGKEAVMQDPDSAGLEDSDAANPGVEILEGDADKTLADARFVIGDYVACTIYPPTQDGRIAPPPRGDPRGPPPNGPRENGGGSYGAPRGGSYRGGSLRGPPPPPVGDWRRGERPPPPSSGYGGGGGGGGSYRGGGRGGRPY